MAPWKERKGKDWDRFELNWDWKILMYCCHVCFLENWGHWRNFGFGFLFFQRFELENVSFQKNFPFNFETNIWWWSRFDNAILTSAAEKSCRRLLPSLFPPFILAPLFDEWVLWKLLTWNQNTSASMCANTCHHSRAGRMTETQDY